MTLKLLFKKEIYTTIRVDGLQVVDLYGTPCATGTGMLLANHWSQTTLEVLVNQHHDTQCEASLPRLTLHAKVRMQQRGIRDGDIEQVVRFGRRIHAKGLTYYVVGRKEVERHALAGKDISRLEGLQVLVQEAAGVVVTTYRNRDFHAIRSTPGGRCRRPPHLKH